MQVLHSPMIFESGPFAYADRQPSEMPGYVCKLLTASDRARDAEPDERELGNRGKCCRCVVGFRASELNGGFGLEIEGQFDPSLRNTVWSLGRGNAIGF